MQLKHPDTKLIAVLSALFLAAATGLWMWLGTASVVPALTLALALLAGLQLHLYRARQAEDAQQLRQVQALHTLFALLPVRSALPPMTGWAASPELALTLYTLVRERRPAHVVELGSGVSTLVVAYALEQNGHGRLTSLDQDAAYGAATEDALRRHGLDSRARVTHAPLTDVRLDGRAWTWYDPAALPEDGPIDLLIVDGPNRALQAMARFPALPLLADRLSPDALVVLDDADRRDEQQAIARWLDAYPGLDVEYRPSPKGTALLRRTAAGAPETAPQPRP